LHANQVTLDIYDAMGRKTEIHDREEYSMVGKNVFTLDTKGLSPGCYYLEIKSTDQRLVGKLIFINE
jgi:hypothetical protein